MLGGEERLEYEVYVDGICLEHVSKLEYLRCVLDESGTDQAERRVAGAIRSPVNARDLQL